MRIQSLVLLLAAGLLAGCSSLVDARSGSEICEIHHQYMREVKISGKHNPQRPSQEYLAARVRGFIHAYPVSLPYHYRTKYVVYICVDCEKADGEWRKAHPDLAPPR